MAEKTKPNSNINSDNSELKSNVKGKGKASKNTDSTASAESTLVSDTERINAINEMYDNQIASQKSNLEASYNQNLSNYEANKNKIAENYYNQRNASAADYERDKRNFNESALSSGLNVGAGSQAKLSMMSTQQKNQNTLRASESSALADNEQSIANLKVQYQSDINSAIANNDYQRAAALLDEYNNQYTRAMEKAQALAQYGDFSGYSSIYGSDTARQMSEVWMIQNPLIAYSLGKIDAEKYYQIVGEYPPGYSTSSSSSSSSIKSTTGYFQGFDGTVFDTYAEAKAYNEIAKSSGVDYYTNQKLQSGYSGSSNNSSSINSTQQKINQTRNSQ